MRFLLAVVAGYATIVLGNVLTLEIWLGGVGYYKSGTGTLVLATLGAIAAGLAGGLVAAWIGGRRPLLHAAGVLVLLTLDTTWVIASGISADPVWFDLGASATLMAATLAGGWLASRIKLRTAMHVSRV